MATKWIILLITSIIVLVDCRRPNRPPKYPITTTTTEMSTQRTWKSTSDSFITEEYSDNDLLAAELPMYPFLNATGLVSLLLETIRIHGLSVCSSPMGLTVMRGNWLNGDGNTGELVHLREICSYKTLVTTTSPSYGRQLRTQPLKIEPIFKAVSQSTATLGPNDQFVYNLIPPKPALRSVMLFAAPRSEEGPLDDKTLQKANAIIKDRSAECKPRKVPVEIPREPLIIWVPSCTVIERCGGCCKHDTLKCVPVPEGITTVKKTVVAMNPNGAYMAIKQVDIEKHNKCRCECKVKASDCNESQTYDSRNCRCACKAKNKVPCTSPQYWDEQSCKCQCPNHTSTECSTGSYFASHLCKCVTADEIVKAQSKRSKA